MKALKDIKVALVCIGKFHLFALAREFLKKGMLERIFSGYPSWKLCDEDIPAECISTFPWLQTPYIAIGKWALLGKTSVGNGMGALCRLCRKLSWSDSNSQCLVVND